MGPASLRPPVWDDETERIVAAVPGYRPATQARSKVSEQAILDAIGDQLADDPLAELTVTSVLERSHRRPGSFYARFDDLNVALDVFILRGLAADDRESDDPLPDTVRGLTNLLVAYANNPRRSALALMQRVVVPGPVHDRWLEARSQLVDRLATAARARSNEPDPVSQGVARATFATLLAMVDVSPMGRHAGRLDRHWTGPDGPYVHLAETVLSGVDVEGPPPPPQPAGRPTAPPRVRLPPSARGQAAAEDFLAQLTKQLMSGGFDAVRTAAVAHDAHRSAGSFFGVFGTLGNALASLAWGSKAFELPIESLAKGPMLWDEAALRSAVAEILGWDYGRDDLQSALLRAALSSSELTAYYTNVRRSQLRSMVFIILQSFPQKSTYRLGALSSGLLLLLDHERMYGSLLDPDSRVEDIQEWAVRAVFAPKDDAT